MIVHVIVRVVLVAFVVVDWFVHESVVLPSFAVVVPRSWTGAGKFAVTLVVVDSLPS